jgi:hypothetical protein
MSKFEEYSSQKVKEFLTHIGMSSGHYNYKLVPCEICDSQEFTVVREVISIGSGKYGYLPVAACNHCGLIMQNPRFDRSFYRDFYSASYRKSLGYDRDPSDEFIQDQIFRAELLFKYLTPILPKQGTVVDIGCSSGAFLLPFRDAGWKTFGIDPDEGYTRYGAKKFGLNLSVGQAEDITLEPSSVDLIIIMGSLEHVFDPNKVLKKCREASKSSAFLMLEGRYTPHGLSKNYFNHNHHRYLRQTSIELIMQKHGWTPIINTKELICGPSRLGNGYCLGRVSDIPSQENFLLRLQETSHEKGEAIKDEFDRLDLQYQEQERSKI